MNEPRRHGTSLEPNARIRTRMLQHCVYNLIGR
jgi:hypothetical protein